MRFRVRATVSAELDLLEAMESLAEYNPSTGADGPLHLVDVFIWVEATSLRQATMQALAVLNQHLPLPVLAIEVQPDELVSQTLAFGEISVDEAANRLGLSRRGVLERIADGTLSAVRRGRRDWVIPGTAFPG